MKDASKRVKEEIRARIAQRNIQDKLVLVGIRGYLSIGCNKRGIYDDAIALNYGDKCFVFEANCDPSIFRQGIATLTDGIWKYKIGIHGLNKTKDKQYKALVQAAPVIVSRDGGVQESGYFGINIHRGSFNSTSSEGCQTIHPNEWDFFISSIVRYSDEAKQPIIPYILGGYYGLK